MRFFYSCPWTYDNFKVKEVGPQATQRMFPIYGVPFSFCGLSPHGNIIVVNLSESVPSRRFVSFVKHLGADIPKLPTGVKKPLGQFGRNWDCIPDDSKKIYVLYFLFLFIACFQLIRIPVRRLFRTAPRDAPLNKCGESLTVGSPYQLNKKCIG